MTRWLSTCHMLWVLHLADRKNHSTVENDDSFLDRVTQTTNTQLSDEVTLIEERRKRREAIKARHRDQAISYIIQAQALDDTSAPSSPKLHVMPEENSAQGELCRSGLIASTNTR